MYMNVKKSVYLNCCLCDLNCPYLIVESVSFVLLRDVYTGCPKNKYTF